MIIRLLFTIHFYSLFVLPYSLLKAMDLISTKKTAVLCFLQKNIHEQQYTEPLLQPDPERKKLPLAVAFSPEVHKQIAVSFDDNTVEVRNVHNTNSIIHSLALHSPVDLLAFTPWSEHKHLIMHQQDSNRTCLRFWNIPNNQPQNIDIVSSSNIQQENLSDKITNIVFYSDRLALQTMSDQNITHFAQSDPAEEWKKTNLQDEKTDPNINTIVSYQKNYMAAFENDTSKLCLIPIINGKAPTNADKTITINTKYLIDHVCFSLDGELVAIITQTNPKKPDQKRVTLWHSSTGKFIMKLDVPDQKNIKSIQLNEDGTKIALLYKDGTLTLVTFQSPSSYKIRQLADTNDVLLSMLDRAIAASKKGISHGLSWQEFRELNALSETQQTYLEKNLPLQLSWPQFIFRLMKEPSVAFISLVTIYFFWLSTKAST
jgi:WD40 repeat protein